ncbi:MAG TPA: cytochrome c, partial [Cyclobacteriaceae bacterium]|nr:cytochrome c [Cyclobacteriaceae bacterium]
SISNSLRVPDRIIGLILLGTGIYLLTQLPTVSSFIVVKLICVLAAIPTAIIALRRKVKVLALLSLLLFVSAVGLTEVSKRKVAMGSIAQIEPMNGKEIFNASCAQCHGVDGKLGVMGATDLSSTQTEWTSIIKTIKNGKGLMVGYKGRLTDAQIAAVADYVKMLKGKSN